MEYDKFFSEDVGSFFRSPVRDIFKKVDLNSIYSFAGGYPPAEAFPMQAIRQMASTVIDKYGAKCFQYGATQGVTELRAAVAARYGVSIDNVQITSSSQQGIDVCTRVLVDPGDVILTSNPSYLGALQSFHSYRADIVGVAHPGRISDSLSTVSPDLNYYEVWRNAIEGCLAAGKKIKFLYMIPDFQNPSGETLTLGERQVLVDLAREFDFLIVEDSPYRELRYEGEAVPTIYSLAPERTLHLGSFSKIFAPGFRLGWILADPALLDKIYVCKQSLDLCPPIMDQYIAAEFMQSGEIDRNIARNISLYRTKRDMMLGLLSKYMPAGITWTHPEGGLFLYLTLPEGFDSIAFYDKALTAGVAYVAGAFFCVSPASRNTMRLNFSFIPIDRMEPGIKLLARLLAEELA